MVHTLAEKMGEENIYFYGSVILLDWVFSSGWMVWTINRCCTAWLLVGLAVWVVLVFSAVGVGNVAVFSPVVFCSGQFELALSCLGLSHRL
jgi:hypothetical protein